MAGRREARPAEAGEAGAEAVDVGRVRAVLALGGVPWDELDDGVQQVRLKLLVTEQEIRDPAAWATVVAARVAADWHRARKRDAGLRKRLSARWARRPPAEHPQEHRVLALAVADGLRELTPAQREVLTLRFYADLPVRDIALLLDVPDGTVKSRLHSAVSALRTRLRETEVI